jgi:hypothetical protein
MMRRHAFFIGILIIVAAARVTILLVSQTHVHSDEAIIGLMGKHILEGRYFPFYMYGQPYNAGAAWEAYLAAIAFALFGVGVIPLKSCIVVLSLVCLSLFYWMCRALYDKGSALLATVAFALAPSLLKWHFQVRGYSWYFLSIPILTILFFSIESSPIPKRRLLFLLGLISGLGIWSLELAVPLVIAVWSLLIVRGKLVRSNVAAGIAGFAIGYAPTIAFNVTHHFSNWRYLLLMRGSGEFAPLFHLSTYPQIFLREMPKFFGPDTILWYYPERSLSGLVFYAIAILAVGLAVWPFLRAPSKLLRALRGSSADDHQQKDLVMLVLTSACFLLYLTGSNGVPSYFFGGLFFLSALTGRMLHGLFSSSRILPRFSGAVVLGAILLAGVGVMIETGAHDQIETLSLCNHGKSYCMTRISAPDLESVQQYLRQHQVTSVWTTTSFVYPLLFESGETLAVSDAIFGYPLRVYPQALPWREPSPDLNTVTVIETDSPFCSPVESRYAQIMGTAPLVSRYGKLSVIDGRPRYGIFR